MKNIQKYNIPNTISNRNSSSWKGITLTDSAAQQINHLILQETNVLGLKISIKKSGCAGFTYKIEKFTSLEEKKNILVYQHNGAKLFIPFNVMPFVDGTELDYVQEGLNYSFKFNNPQIQFVCGCGESFNI